MVSGQFMEGLLMDIITEAAVAPFQYGFMVRALFVSILVGIMCPVLGAYVVVRGLGFMSDGLAHSLLPGLVVAALLVAVISSEWIILVPNAIAFALLIGFLSKRTGLSEDTSIGILFAGLFALGLTLLTAARGLKVSLESVLLGQVLGVSRDDVLVTAALADRRCGACSLRSTRRWCSPRSIRWGPRLWACRPRFWTTCYSCCWLS